MTDHWKEWGALFPKQGFSSPTKILFQVRFKITQNRTFTNRPKQAETYLQNGIQILGTDEIGVVGGSSFLDFPSHE